MVDRGFEAKVGVDGAEELAVLSDTGATCSVASNTNALDSLNVVYNRYAQRGGCVPLAELRSGA